MSEEGSFANSEDRIALLKRGVGSVGWEGNGRRGVWRKSVEKTLSNKVGHGGDSVDLMGRLLMKDVTSSWERAQIALGFTKVSEHVSPGAFGSRRASIPETEILLENGLTGENHKRHVHHLLRSHGRESMLGEISKVVDSVEDSVNRERDVVVHVEGGHLLCFDLLRPDFSVSGKKMQENSMNIGGILASSKVEQQGL